MPPALSTTPRTAKLPDTAAWLLLAGLLLGLLWLGHLARPSLVPPQATSRPAQVAPSPSRILSSTWRH